MATKVLLRAFSTLFLLTLSFYGVAEKRIPTEEDINGFELLRGFSVSPDGDNVLFRKSKNDIENNQFLNQLWLLNVKAAQSIQLTYGDKSVANFGWLPNGEWLYFKRDNKLGFMRRNGGEAQYIEIKEKGFGNIKFSADGQLMAFIATPAKDKKAEARKEHFGDFEVVQADGVHRHIYVVKLTSDLKLDGKIEAVTSGKDFSVFDFDLSADGKKIAFTAAKRPDLATLKTLDLYRVDVASKKVQVLDKSNGLQGSPIISPDGSQVVYTTSKGFAYNNVAYVLSMKGGTPRALTADFDENVYLSAWNDKGIFFSANTKTRSHIYSLNPKSGKTQRITKNKEAMITQFRMSNSGKTIIYSAATDSSLSELYVQRGKKIRRLTDFSKQLEDLIIAQRQLISWKAEDGADIEGVLMTPKDFDPKKKYPLFVVTHGGPTSYDRPDLSRMAGLYPFDEWVGRGAILLQTNYRGSNGYGEAFRRLNWRNLGVGPATDIIAGINHLIGKGYVDESKIGCLGWSQGGHISAMLATYSDRCTVAHMGAGISNWKTYYYNTDITLFTVEYFGKTPVEDNDIYRKTSPITYLDRAKTPVLIQHGENDRRVPLANAYELRQGLIDVGVEAPMVVYKGMGHGPGNPKSLMAVRTHLNAWFSHYLFEDEKPNFSTVGIPEKDDKDAKTEKSDNTKDEEKAK